MKRFILQILLFALITGAIWFSCVLIISIQVKKQSFAIDSSRTIITLGNSMGECSINPECIPRIANFCQSADHYLHCYLKLKFLLRDNVQIDTVLLIFSPSTFGPYADNPIFTDDAASYKMKNYYPLMEAQDFKPFLFNKLLWFNLSSLTYLKSLIKHEAYINQLGGYLYLERNKLYQDIEKRNQEINTKPQYGDEYQKKYLVKIIDLCSIHEITLILIQPPIYHADFYYDMHYCDSVLKQVVAPKIELLDFSRLELADSLYGDITHLNHRGAEFFSRILSDTLFRQPFQKGAKISR